MLTRGRPRNHRPYDHWIASNILISVDNSGEEPLTFLSFKDPNQTFILNPIVSPPRLMVRKCYDVLAQEISRRYAIAVQYNLASGIVVTGTPDTGKSCFANWFLMKCILDTTRDYSTIVDLFGQDFACLHPDGTWEYGVRSVETFYFEYTIYI